MTPTGSGNGTGSLTSLRPSRPVSAAAAKPSNTGAVPARACSVRQQQQQQQYQQGKENAAPPRVAPRPAVASRGSTLPPLPAPALLRSESAPRLPEFPTSLSSSSLFGNAVGREGGGGGAGVRAAAAVTGAGVATKAVSALVAKGKILGSRQGSLKRISSEIVKTMPRSGGWLGWYTSSDREMLKIFYEVSLSIDPTTGTLTGGPREESSPFACSGQVSRDEPHRVHFLETEVFGHDVVFDGVFVEDAIAGRWRRRDASEPRGTLRPGRWAGCCWSDADNIWIQASFAWLEVRNGVLYGKDDLTDDDVFKTTRGTYDPRTGQLRIIVTEWFEQDSTVTIYRGLLSRDGHVRGTWVSSETRDLEDLGGNGDDGGEDALPREEEDATFRMWRVDGEDEVRYLAEPGDGRRAPIAPGTWAGTWLYEGGLTSPDHCSWELRCTPSGYRIQGEGTSILEGLEEAFVCDGTYDPETGKVKLYQSYLTTLSIYVYDLVVDDAGTMTGKGSSKDDSDGLVVDFSLRRR
ncbi:hypothetical protein HK101_000775 [Irineochytrium annulatum]|nr:hypothetical protein HK101_000775 [Irineochytrium annulatum]